MTLSNKFIIRSAQLISILFSPFYLPVIVFTVLLFFSYLSYMPWFYNARIIAMVYLFTVLLPRLGIFLYRRLNKWSRWHLSNRKNRFIPYFISIICYSTLLLLMESLKMPRFTMGVIICALIVQGVCLIINSWVKISTHAAAAGGLIGLLMAFSLLFRFNPIVWLCISILVCGIVCTARLILRVHTPINLALGVAIGILCGFFSILLF